MPDTWSGMGPHTAKSGRSAAHRDSNPTKGSRALFVVLCSSFTINCLGFVSRRMVPTCGVSCTSCGNFIRFVIPRVRDPWGSEGVVKRATIFLGYLVKKMSCSLKRSGGFIFPRSTPADVQEYVSCLTDAAGTLGPPGPMGPRSRWTPRPPGSRWTSRPPGADGPLGPRGTDGPPGPGSRVLDVVDLSTIPEDLFCYRRDDGLVFWSREFLSSTALERGLADPMLSHCVTLGHTYHCHTDERRRLRSMFTHS